MKKIILLLVLNFVSFSANLLFAQTFTNYTTDNGLVSNVVYCVAIDMQGNKWFGTDAGVSKFDGVSWTTFTTNDGLISNVIVTIAVDLQNNIWFGSGFEGVTKFDGTNWTSYTASNVLLNNGIREIAVDSIGNVWIGVNGGLSKYNGTNWTNYTVTNGLANNSVSAISVDHDGNMWFGTYMNGVSLYNGTSWTNYNTTTSNIADNYIEDIAIDVHGNKWFATNMGVSKYDDNNWTTFNYTNSALTTNYINSVCGDIDGNIYVADYASGFYKYDGINWMHYTVNEGLAGTRVYEMIVENGKNIWLVTNGGVSVFNSAANYIGNCEKNKLFLYPNPADDHLIIKNFEQNLEIRIYDLSGKLLINYKLENEQVDISKLPNGFYTIKIRLNNREIVNKFVKQ